MAVKLINADGVNAKRDGKITASLFADSKEDVTQGVHIIGMPTGYELEMGSSILTADGEIAFLKSDGTWNWV